MSLVVLILLTAAPAYILGGVNGAIIVSKLFYRMDIRQYGSGNPGLTNFVRVFGKRRALMVVFIDVVKTIAPLLLGGWLFGRFFGSALLGRELAGLFVFLGHCYPVFYGFKGGKGVMAMGAVVFFIDWRVTAAAWGTFVLIVLITRYVSLGAMLAATAMAVSQFLLGVGVPWEAAITALIALLLILRHKTNIVRLIKAEETKLSLRRKE